MSTQTQRDQVLAKLDVVAFYEGEGLELKEDPPGSNQYKTLCCFHEEDTGSLSIRGSDGMFFCFGCSEKGSPFDFYSKRHGVGFPDALEALAAFTGVVEETKPIDDTEVQGWHEALLGLPTKLAYLHDDRGLTDETIKVWRIGFDGDRYTIPIVELDGTIVNVRRYKPRATQKMISYAQNYGGTQLLGKALIASADTILIGEGEFDAIVAWQHHFMTVTATNGAGRWRDRWNELFRGKHVILVQDNDPAGRKGNTMIAAKLFGIAASVRIVVWPKDYLDKGDITDWFVKLGHSEAEFQALLENAVPYVPQAEGTAALDFALTDDGNSLRFVEDYKSQLLYCSMWNQWFLWDDVRWRRDELKAVQEKAKTLIRRLTIEAMHDPDDKELNRHLEKSQSGHHLREMVTLAESDLTFAVHPDQLDQEPWLLVCENGTLDLATGELRASDADDLLTRIVPVKYDPTARSDAWDKFIETVTGGDKEVKSYLKRAVGYSLTGSTREEKLFFVWGPTQTGKSTFLEAVKRMLGDYAMTTNFHTFLEKRGGSGENLGDIASMKGTRFITSIEVDEGKKLAESLVKQLTGGDKIKARFFYKEAFEFAVTSKFWLSANNRPHASMEDDAIWRRIALIPFDIPIPNPDPSIKEELLNTAKSGPAILAWAVQGCLEWQREGLKTPTKVDVATKEYRAEQNPIIDWFNEEVAPYEKGRASTSELYRSYVTWCKDNGVRYMIKAKTMTSNLKNMGYDVVEGSGHQRYISGVILRQATEAKSEGKY